MQLDRTSSVIVHDPPDAGAQALINQYGLQPWIDEACHLIMSCFDVTGRVAIERHSDPEMVDEWITLRILARGEMEHVLDGYDDITKRRVEILPPPIARKVRVSVGMADV